MSIQSQFSSQSPAGEDVLRSLFPPSVVVVERRRPGNPADLLPAEAVYVAKAVAKRVNEFAAGRACAREALGAFGVTGFALLAAPDRQPLWPTGYVGSITHTAGFCAAAVVRRSNFMALGLDSERSGAPSVDVWPTLCRSEELAWVHSLAPGERHAAVTLIFSAKEAVYKCQYPVTGEWLDFHDLKVEVPQWGNPRGSFTVSATRDIKIAQRAKLPQGRFIFHEEFVSTALCIPAP